MSGELDSVALYARSLGHVIRRRTVLVEGTTDVELFELAARLEFSRSGLTLLGDDLAIIAAGEGDRGGTSGVIRELVAFRGMARTYLQANGVPHYRFIGLLDNDRAGRQAVKTLRDIDSSIVEFKDVFRIWPAMPLPGNLDPGTVAKTYERENASFKGLDWELEDLIPQSFFDELLKEYPGAISHTSSQGGRVHRDMTRDGKARFHRLVKQHAIRDDLDDVVRMLIAIRLLAGVPRR
jgi:hypothetical protein